MKKTWTRLALALLVLMPCAARAATTYIDVPVQIEGGTYPDQEIVQIIWASAYSWPRADPPFYGNATTFLNGLVPDGERVTIKLALAPAYGETVDHWSKGRYGDPVFTQVFTTTITGGMRNRIDCHIAPPPQPITGDDMPRANTPTGTPVNWGPKTMDGGGVRTYSGEATEMVTDLHVKGRGLDFVWARRYLAEKGVDSAIGRRWDHAYDIRVSNAEDFDGIKYLNMGNGRLVEFHPGAYVPPYDYYEAKGWAAKMRRNFWSQDEEIELLFDSGVKWVFTHEPFGNDTVSLLDYIEDQNGNRLTFTYGASTGIEGGTNDTGRLVRIEDTLGRIYDLAYYPEESAPGEPHPNAGKIHTLTDPTGRTITYTYADGTNGTVNTLKQVDYPDSRSLKYNYSGLHLTEIVDPRNVTILTNVYSGNKVIKQTRPHQYGTAPAIASYSVTNYTYTTFENDSGVNVPLTIVNDPVGNVQLQIFNRKNQLAELRDYTGRAPDPVAPVLWNTAAGAFAGNGPEGKLRDTDPPYFASTCAWNEHDNLTQTVQLEFDEATGNMVQGLTVDYAYEDETAPLKRGAVKTVTETHPGEPGSIVAANTYAELASDPDLAFHRIAVRTSKDPALYETTYQYDSGNNDRGNLTAIAYPGGSMGAPDEVFEYDLSAGGRLEAHTLPKSIDENGAEFQKVDRYTYHGSGDGLGLIESVVSAHGSSVPLTTSYEYYPNGTLMSVEQPGGQTWSYTYNDSDEILTATAPGLGGTTTYIRDAGGNVEEVHVQNLDETGSPMPQAEIVTAFKVDPLGRIVEQIEDFGGLGATTQYEYDKNGQNTKTLTPLAVAGTEPTYYSTATYDERGALFRSSTFERPADRFDYNDYGQLSRTVVAEGTPVPRVITADYDGYGRKTAQNLPDEIHSNINEFDPRGLPKLTNVVGKGKSAVNDDPPSSQELAKTSYVYDFQGQVTHVRQGADTAGAVIQYTRAGQKKLVQDPDGKQTTYSYDRQYRLLRVTDPLGNITSCEYYTSGPSNGMLKSVTQVDLLDGDSDHAQTLSTEYEYDTLLRVSKVTDTTGRNSQFWYDARGNLVKSTDGKGQVASFIYDALSRKKEAIFAGSGPEFPIVTKTDWDLNSNLVARTDPKDKVTTYEYNDQGYTEFIHYADGGTYTMEYDDFGQVTRTIDPAGNQIIQRYDALGRMVRKTTFAEQDPPAPGGMGQSGMAHVSEVYLYDGLSRLLWAANQGARVHYAYNFVDGEPTVWEAIQTRVTPSLATADLESDQVYEQSLADLVREGVAPVTRTYTHAGRLKSVEYPSGRTISYSRYDNGPMKDISDATLGVVAHYSYRGGRVAGRTLGGVLQTTVVYDPATYDAHISGVTHTKVQGGATLDTWAFDWDGNYNKLKRHRTGALAKVHEYQYDARNRMTQSLIDTVPSISYPLDASGNRTGASYSTAGTLHEYVTSPLGPMTYDGNGNLFDVPDEYEHFQYDAQNALLDRWSFGNILQDDYVGAITADYAILAGDFTAAAGYLAPQGGGTILNETVPADVDQVTFSYLSKLDPDDPDGDGDPATGYGPDYYALFVMKVGQENAAPPDDEWSYLSLAIEPQGLVLRKWQDDDVVVVDEYTVTSARDTWYDVQVDFSGTGNEHVTVKHGPHGGAMATAVDASTGLASDHVNVGFAVGKLADDGYLFDNLRIRGNSISAESMEQEFIYDVFGRRVAKTTYDNYIARTTYYAYDGDRVVEELDGNHNVVASYVYGNYIDEVLEMWRDADGDEAIDPAERFYYLQDDMYNVVALADHEGDIVERYAYGDYGYPTVYDAGNIETGNQSAYGNPYLFNGRHWDADTGLYWYRTRYMDPELGRFISRDTIGLWGDENNVGNPYTYAGNNPWTHLDPYGQWAWDNDWIEYGVGGLLGLKGKDVFVEGVREMHIDAAKGVKGIVWTGPKNAVVGVATVVAHPIQTALGARDFAYAAYNDFGGTASAIGNSITQAATDPEAIGAFTFDIMAGVATGGAAKSTSAGKLTSMLKRIDRADNQGPALIPSAHGALGRAPDGGGPGPRPGQQMLFDFGDAPSTQTHRGLREFEGESHVYAIRSPDGGLYKIGKSSQGTRQRDGASLRAEQQVRQLNRDIGPGHTSELRATFSNGGEALDYERRLRDLYRKLYGQDKLPGNQENY